MPSFSLPSTERRASKDLRTHYDSIRTLSLRRLFTDDPERGKRLALDSAGFYLDYSKNLVTDETLKLLIKLAEESDLRSRIEAMFRGDKVNVTENRSVLHIALRAPRGMSILVDGENVVPQVQGVLDKMSIFSERV